MSRKIKAPAPVVDHSFDVASAEAKERLAAWSSKARALFAELLEDAASDLQRELLSRAVASGHTPAEVHAFADALRPLSDDEAFDGCSLETGSPGGYSVVQLLRAEADPLYAFELKGGELSPADLHEPAGPELAPYQPPGAPQRPHPNFVADDPRLLKSSRALGFQSPANSGRHRVVDPNDLGRSAEAPRPPSGPAAAVPPPGQGPVLMQDLLNEATRSLGISFREQSVDEGTLTLEAALESAAQALQRGVPVPVALGPSPGQHRRFALLLQLSSSGRSRAWQLYDPFSQELAWANEGDLLARAELPFANKANRRITRIALPSMNSSPRF